MKKRTNSGEKSVVDNRALLQHFNLSRNKSLQTLETTAESITGAGSTAPAFLRTVLSTVTSPAPLDVVIVYRDYDFGYIENCLYCRPDPACFRHRSRENRALDILRRKHQLRVFHAMRKVRDFRLVLCADVFDCVVEHAIQALGLTANAWEMDRWGLDCLYKPLIISERRAPRTRASDNCAGWLRGHPGIASAL